MLRIKLTVSALIIGLTAGGSAVLAQQPQTNNPAITTQQPGRAGLMRRGMRRRARRGRLRMLRELNLTDQQKEQVRSIIQTQAQSTRTQRQELRGLTQQWRAGTLTPEGLARAKDLRAQLMESRKGVHAQMMNVLTAEQKAKLEEIRKTRRANHEMFGRRNPLN